MLRYVLLSKVTGMTVSHINLRLQSLQGIWNAHSSMFKVTVAGTYSLITHKHIWLGRNIKCVVCIFQMFKVTLCDILHSLSENVSTVCQPWYVSKEHNYLNKWKGI